MAQRPLTPELWYKYPTHLVLDDSKSYRVRRYERDGDEIRVL